MIAASVTKTAPESLEHLNLKPPPIWTDAPALEFSVWTNKELYAGDMTSPAISVHSIFCEWIGSQVSEGRVLSDGMNSRGRSPFSGLLYRSDLIAGISSNLIQSPLLLKYPQAPRCNFEMG